MSGAINQDLWELNILPTTRLVLLWLAWVSDEAGLAQDFTTNIAERCSVTVSDVLREMLTLTGAGLIRFDDGCEINAERVVVLLADKTWAILPAKSRGGAAS